MDIIFQLIFPSIFYQIGHPICPRNYKFNFSIQFFNTTFPSNLSNYFYYKILPTTFPTQGAWEVDQQCIISGVKECSRHLNKKIGLPISLFLEQTRKILIRFPKTLPISFFEMKPLRPPYLTTVYHI